jgi:hypothetical protein
MYVCVHVCSYMRVHDHNDACPQCCDARELRLGVGNKELKDGRKARSLGGDES